MLIERANAKINLYLNVTGRRENGYHDIVSIMQTVSLCDLVTVGYTPSAYTRITLRASGNDAMPTDCRNLAWRAAEAYLGAIGQGGEVFLSIEKHIPMAAGLAGGSADAAAVLRGLNRLCGNRLSLDRLCALGAALGADIPFCLMGGGARVEGIGDRLRDIPAMPQCAMVVACMGEGVSTPWAYGALDEKNGNFAHTPPVDARVEKLTQAIGDGDIQGICAHTYNIFEQVVPQKQPYVDRLKAEMLAGGALVSMMSGSGPSVFGIFASSEVAQKTADALQKMGASAFACHPTKRA